MNSFMPFPGTPYWRNSDKLGLYDIAPFEDWTFYNQPVCATANLTKTETLNWLNRFEMLNNELTSSDGRVVSGALNPVRKGGDKHEKL